MPLGSRYTRNILLAFAVVALGFLGSTLYLSIRNLRIDERATGLLTNALPSLEHLDAACDAIRDLEAATEALPDLPPGPRVEALKGMDATWQRVHAELETYRVTPDYEGEERLYASTVPPSIAVLEAADRKVRARVDANDAPGARDVVEREMRPAARHAIALIGKVMELNADHAYDDVRAIAALRKTGDELAIALSGGAVFLGLLASLWVLRVFAAYGRLLNAHSALVEQRAADLEQFGRRVAHDLLSPLSALSFCLSAFKKPSEGDPKLEDALGRAKACIVRAQALVDGVFEFSRAGGKPKVGDDADVTRVLTDTVAELSASMDEKGPTLEVAPFAPYMVACSPGVLTAILSNLLRNATKYMSDSAVKKITVRVLPEGENVTIEIEDTGPGVPPGLESIIFEPYVRAQGVTQPGLGLGLATVKRFCVAHGGEVGVRSSPGLGAVFWFTLPKSR